MIFPTEYMAVHFSFHLAFRIILSTYICNWLNYNMLELGTEVATPIIFLVGTSHIRTSSTSSFLLQLENDSPDHGKEREKERDACSSAYLALNFPLLSSERQKKPSSRLRRRFTTSRPRPDRAGRGRASQKNALFSRINRALSFRQSVGRRGDRPVTSRGEESGH